MNRAQGNDILHMVRNGLGDFSQETINAALRATGDLRQVERKTTPSVAKEVDRILPRVWISALAGGNSAHP